MKPKDIAAWTIACGLAVMSHAAGVLAFASLLREGHPQPRSELRLDHAGLPQPRPVAELASASTTLSPAAESAALASIADGAREITDGSDSAAVAESSVTETLQSATPSPSVYGSNAASPGAASSPSPALAENVSSLQGLQELAPAVQEASGTPDQSATASTEVVIAAPESTGSSSEAESQPVANATPVLSIEASPASQAAPVFGETSGNDGAAPVQAEVTESAAPVTETVVAEQSDNEVQDSGEKLALATPIVQQPIPQPQRPAAIDVARAVSEFSGGTCFLAVARQDAPERWNVTSYGAATPVLDAFATHLKTQVPVAVSLNRRSLQTAQCAAIDFANGIVVKAPAAFVFETDSRQLTDGDQLTATISGITKKWTYILLVDDEGMALEISKFASRSDSGIRLEVPVHVRGDGRARTQLLFAISSDHELSLLEMQQPQPLRQLMPMLRGQIVASKALVEIAVADFEVE